MRISDLKDLNKEDILASLGLASKPSTGEWMLGTFGLFGLGLVVGASVALLIAPKPGTELRRDIGQKISSIRNTAERELEHPLGT